MASRRRPLPRRAQRLPGRIVLVHQAAEEAGSLGKRRPSSRRASSRSTASRRSAALTTEPNLPRRRDRLQPRSLQAASDGVYITLRGEGTCGGRHAPRRRSRFPSRRPDRDGAPDDRLPHRSTRSSPPSPPSAPINCGNFGGQQRRSRAN
ncbi:MAG: hypothetical protein ACLUNV_08215 [Sutterella wadsworthensis]